MIVTNPIPIAGSDPRGALILYENLLTASTTSDAEKALIPNTYERWRPSSGAVTVKFQLSTLSTVDSIGIAAHALAGESFILSTATTIGGALTERAAATPADNGALLFTFDAVDIQEIAFTATLAATGEIGVVYAGKTLQMERNIYGGHSPLALSQKTEFRNNQSESGQILNRDIIRQGTAGSFAWQFIDPDWYRENFQPFVLSARTTPFFINWRPDLYSQEVVFGQTNGDIMPSNMGTGHRLMSVSMAMKGHADL